MKTSTYNRLFSIGVLCACLCVPIIFSFMFFQGQSLRLDESQSLWQSSHSPRMILELIAQDVHVPLYPEMLHGWLLLFGEGVVTARKLSLMFFLFSIPMFYLVGKRIVSAETSLFATVLFSISPFMNWYANETRMYSLFVLVALIHTYFFLGIIKRDDRSSWIYFALWSVVGAYTHYFFFILFFADACFFIFNRRFFGPFAHLHFLKVLGVIFAAFAPWVGYVVYLGKLSNSSPNLIRPSSVDLFNTFSEFFIGFQNDYINTIFLSLWPLVILLGFLALRRNMRLTLGVGYVVLAFSLPIALAFFVSLYVRPIFLPRYLIFTLPPLYVFLSWLISRYPKTLTYIIGSFAVLAAMIGLAIEGVSSTTPVKEDFRGVAQYLERNAASSDIIVVSAPFTIYPISYYYHGPNKILTLPIWDQNKIGQIPPFSESELPKDIETIRDSHRNMWLVLSYDQGYSEKIRMFMDTHFQILDKKSFSSGIVIYEYKFRYD